MLKILTDPRMLDHRPPATHPERPERLETTLRELKRSSLNSLVSSDPIRPATDEQLLLVHPASHLESIRGSAAQGGGQIEADTWTSSGSDLAARVAVGAVVSAVDEVVTRSAQRVFCLVRPPGHHARPRDPMGFCLYGSVAVGAVHAIARHEIERILIVDWDVHHGNGTQEIFYDDPRVGFFSIHRHPFYPGSGTAGETGAARGLGSTRNVPLPFGVSRDEYLAAFRHGIESFADQIRPELILVSAGFDAHAEDPVGNLGLDTEDFTTMTDIIQTLADHHTAGRWISVLEGGYNRARLADCVCQHIRDLQ